MSGRNLGHSNLLGGSKMSNKLSKYDEKEISANEIRAMFLAGVNKTVRRNNGLDEARGSSLTGCEIGKIRVSAESSINKCEEGMVMSALIIEEMAQANLTKIELASKVNITVEELDKVIKSAYINNLKQLELLSLINPSKYNQRYLQLKIYRNAFNTAAERR